MVKIIAYILDIKNGTCEINLRSTLAKLHITILNID